MVSKAKKETLGALLDALTVEGALYEVEDSEDKRIRCYACGHRCLIKEGRRGICQVRFNDNGVLRVPHGYVGALQVDPIEKKPFFHALPGTDALSFGMLGCDYHCHFCFTPDTPIITEQGMQPIATLFGLGSSISHPDGEIAFPTDLRVVSGSGKLRRVDKVFKHPYRGSMTVIKPYYLPEIVCTPDHRVYATDDPTRPPEKIEARNLTMRHMMVIPNQYVPELLLETSQRQYASNTAFAEAYISTDDFLLVSLESLSEIEYEGDVYNLEVEEEHNYLANFMLVSNCQNWLTSQTLRDDNAGVMPQVISAEGLVELTKQRRAKSIASTYNEPLITTEWAVDVFKVARQAGLRTLYISNGNATPEALQYLRPYIDAYKIDLKTMNDANYRKIIGGVLQNVLDTIQMAHDLGIWVEVVTLVIPGMNDSTDELWDAARYIHSVSPDIPWHVTAFHPDYKMDTIPRTTVDTLLRAAEIGTEAGLNYVYAGNLPGKLQSWEDTRCPTCQTTLIRRVGFTVLENRLGTHGICPKCQTRIPGLWV